MKDLRDLLRCWLAGEPFPPGPVLVAVSGGLDSLVLLDLLAGAQADLPGKLIIGHVEHGIHPASLEAVSVVERAAARYQVPLEITRLALGPRTGETRARIARWEALRGMRDRHGAGSILTAHHRDDLVETVLQRVFAGSGPAGLVGIPSRNGDLRRPLLGVSKAALSSHAAAAGITSWWDDPANQDTRHDRAWLRTVLLPLLRDRKPDVDRRLASLAAQAVQNRAGWEQVLGVLPGLDPRTEGHAVSVAAASLRGYHSPLASCVVMALARGVGCLIGMAAAGRAIALLDALQSGARADLGGGWIAELSFGRLRIAPSGGQAPDPLKLWGALGVWNWGGWTVEVTSGSAPAQLDRGGWSSWFERRPLTLRAWRPGDRVFPLGGCGSRPVVRCLQEARVPASRRAEWPVLEDGPGHPVWIPGVCRGKERVPLAGTEALRIDVGFS